MNITGMVSIFMAVNRSYKILGIFISYFVLKGKTMLCIWLTSMFIIFKKL